MAKLTPEQKAQDIISYRIIIIFTVALISILALIPLRRYVDSPTALLLGFPLLKLLIGIALLAAVGGVLLSLLRRRRGKDQALCLFRGLDITVGALAVAVSMVFLLVLRTAAVKVLFFAFPAVCVLAIIYYIYQREFTITSLYAAASVLGLYLTCYCRTAGRPYQAILWPALTLLLGLGLNLLMNLARTKGGRLFGIELCGAKATLLGPRVYLLLSLAAFVLAYLWPHFLPIMLGLLAAYAVILVVYTTRLS